jgi:hypothetical protein
MVSSNSGQWAQEQFGKANFNDPRRTGRASVKVLWEGWFWLQTILKGYELAMSLEHVDL